MMSITQNFKKVILLGCMMALGYSQETKCDSPYYIDGVFRNPGENFDTTLGDMASFMWYMASDKTENKSPQEGEVPVVKLTQEDIINLKDNSVIRFAHSTLLIKVDNRLILIDPMFSHRASPVSFAGTPKFHEDPISVEELPFIDIVIISHNHYDHLDVPTLEKLKEKVGHIYTTLGIGEILEDIGYPQSVITELDWWQSKEDKTLSIRATPSQHYSGRGMFDKNKTFWASWVIQSSGANLFFSSDSGYNDDFKKIGEKFGPFDMAFIEAGQYDEKWKSIHMMPKESVQANIDLKAKILFPIHNGSFTLAVHPWMEPLELVTQYAKELNMQVAHPKMGEAIPLLEYKATDNWWRKEEL